MTADPPVTAAIPDIPPGHQQSAERIRAHLVVLRGGALFLSPMDCSLLVGWLDAGIPVPRVLSALEQAADRRRQKRNRVPLDLSHAESLVRNGGIPPSQAPGGARRSHQAQDLLLAAEDHAASWRGAPHPLSTLIHLLRASNHPLHPTFPQLEQDLLALDPGEDLSVRASDLLTAWWDQTWTTLGSVGRAPYLKQAHIALADLADLLDEGRLAELAEEHGRGLLRAELPMLSATFLCGLLDP